MAYSLMLIDIEDYEFIPSDDVHVTLNSNFAERTGLRKCRINTLNPKLKGIGALVIMLPDDDNDYSMGLMDGTVREA